MELRVPARKSAVKPTAAATNALVARFLVAAAVVALSACGQVSKRNDAVSSSGGAGVGGSGAGSGGEVLDPCRSPAPPEVPLRALHEPELRNELAIFEQPLEDDLFPPAPSRLFDTEPAASATSQFVQGYAQLVSRLAASVTSDSATLARLLGCDVDRLGSEGCEEELYDFVIARLFRGRRDADTAAELAQVFDAGVTLGGDFRSGARALLEVALQSPEFLYRPELGRSVEGRSAEWSQPTDVEMASRLSFLFWDRGPDDELLAAAARGALSEPGDIEAQARRLLADDRAKSAVRRFYRELMSPEADAQLDVAVPEFTPAVIGLMDQEFAGFVDHATFTGGGDFAALFEPNTWVNGPLASYYGLPGIEGDAFRTVELDPSRFAGILTQPAWLTRASLAGFTDPSRRGWVISRALLCTEIPSEPKGVMDHPPAPVPDKTTRERLAIHNANPACASCHQAIDPLGFALEHIDAVGRYRETENGLTIDASGELAADAGTFDGAVQLGARLVESQAVRDCFVTQWQRFAFGRVEEQASECSRSELRGQFATNDNVIELLVALTQTDSFRFRKVQP
jgi:hypothetical protein